MTKTVLYVVCACCVVGGVGCVALSEWVTPATIDQRAVEFAEESGVVGEGTFEGYPNLDKANRLANAVLAAYEINDLVLEQLQENNNLNYTLLNEVVVRNQKQAQAREEMLFSEQGLLSLGLAAFGISVPAGLFGLSRKRTGDWTPQEHETALGAIKGTVTDKDRQMLELVRGVQKFLDVSESGKELKLSLEAAQSADTRIRVAQLKATI